MNRDEQCKAQAMSSAMLAAREGATVTDRITSFRGRRILAKELAFPDGDKSWVPMEHLTLEETMEWSAELWSSLAADEPSRLLELSLSRQMRIPRFTLHDE